jgi:hypothetical protein
VVLGAAHCRYSNNEIVGKQDVHLVELPPVGKLDAGRAESKKTYKVFSRHAKNSGLLRF